MSLAVKDNFLSIEENHSPFWPCFGKSGPFRYFNFCPQYIMWSCEKDCYSRTWNIVSLKLFVRMILKFWNTIPGVNIQIIKSCFVVHSFQVICEKGVSIILEKTWKPTFDSQAYYAVLYYRLTVEGFPVVPPTTHCKTKLLWQ